jgi:hypothetical protein
MKDIKQIKHLFSRAAFVFFNANYEIKPLLEFIFQADWFYDDKNTGNLIKSPIDFMEPTTAPPTTL